MIGVGLTPKTKVGTGWISREEGETMRFLTHRLVEMVSADSSLDKTTYHNLTIFLESSVKGIFDSMDDHSHTLGSD